MNKFIRTTSGHIAKYLFFREPLVWVEGSSDIPIYDRLLSTHNYRIEPAGGKHECIKLAAAIVKQDLPYIVIIDGDYEILERKRSKHRRVILLNRHSIENYLFEEDPVNHVCCNYSAIGNHENLLSNSFSSLVQHIETELFDLLVIDVAHYRADTQFQPFPDTHHGIMNSREKLLFASDQISELCKRHRAEVDMDGISESESLINAYIEERRFVDLIKGHFIFGILRDLFINTIRKETGNLPNIDNNGLRILMASVVWEYLPSSDHISLKRRLYRALSEVTKIRSFQGK